MVGVGAQYRTILVLEDYGVINVCRIISGCIGCIACTSNNRLIPTCESIGESVVCGSRRILRCCNVITEMISLTAYHATVVILECNGIINVFLFVNRGIFLVAVTRSRDIAPILEGIGISIIRCSYGICRNGYCIAEVICFSAYDRTVVILEYNCIIDKGRLILCGEGCVTGTSSECLVPRQECVSVGFVALSFGIRNRRNRITVMILNRLNETSIPIKEPDIVLDIGSCVIRRIFSIPNAGFRNRFTPILEGISICVICRLGGSFGNVYGTAVMVGIRAQYRAVFILKYNGIVNID